MEVMLYFFFRIVQLDFFFSDGFEAKDENIEENVEVDDGWDDVELRAVSSSPSDSSLLSIMFSITAKSQNIKLIHLPGRAHTFRMPAEHADT